MFQSREIATSIAVAIDGELKKARKRAANAGGWPRDRRSLRFF
jgi:hypothetical protein